MQLAIRTILVRRNARFIAIYFMIVVTLSAATGISAKPSASAEPGLNADKRNRNAVLKYLGPLLGPAKKSARLYYFETCEANDPVPIPFPRLRLRPASKDKQGLDAVRDIFADDKRVSVLERDGITRINVGTVSPALLQTKIP
jgi:hypothetical protein